LETGLTLVAHAKLPLHFWDHAFLTATYLINRMPSPTLANKSPFFLLHLQFPDYKSLKSFGCACFPFIRPYNSQKMNFHSTECVFLGYSPNHKGYKCLGSTGKIFISKDVIFNEIKFPYVTLFPTDQTTSLSHDASTLPTSFPLFTSSTVSSSSTTPPNLSHLNTPRPSLDSTSSHNNNSPIRSHSSPITHTQQTPETHHNHTSPGSDTSTPVYNPTPITVISPSPSDSSQATESSPSVSSSVPTQLPPHRIHPHNNHSMATRGKVGLYRKDYIPLFC